MKSSTVQLNDMQMYLEIDGVGEPVVLLHGGGGLSPRLGIHLPGASLALIQLIIPDARGTAVDQSPEDDYSSPMRARHSGCADHLGTMSYW